VYKLILIPVDGSESSRQALEEGLLLAAQQRASVRLVHIFESMGHVVIEGVVDLDQSLRQQGELVLWEAAERAGAYGVKATTALVEAGERRVAAAIVDEAESAGADLIAMGTHGRRGVEKLLLGSVAEGVARRASVPVLLIRKSGSGPLSI
jgi:nucleotide-binding universal stress UspA family protein